MNTILIYLQFLIHLAAVAAFIWFGGLEYISARETRRRVLYFKRNIYDSASYYAAESRSFRRSVAFIIFCLLEIAFNVWFCFSVIKNAVI